MDLGGDAMVYGEHIMAQDLRFLSSNASFDPETVNLLSNAFEGAWQRVQTSGNRCEGRKSWVEINPELVHEAKRLRRRSPKGHQRSLREIAAELAKRGFVNERGAVFSASSVRSMLA